MLLYLFLTCSIALKTTPLEPFQGSWQASVPIPIMIRFDVPATSFVQAEEHPIAGSFLQILPPFPNPPAGNSYAIRVQPPEETPAVLSSEIEALKYQEEVGLKTRGSETQSRGVVLLETVSQGVTQIVHDIIAPLRALPNPLA